MTAPTALDDLVTRLQRLEDDAEIRRITTRMATLADSRAWDELVEVFSPVVTADWSELSGAPAEQIPAADLVASWRAGLSGLTATQHLLGNQHVDVDGDSATATAYVHAAHRLASGLAGQVWVVAGQYDYRLTRTENGWRINAATFHPAWGWGNQHVMTTAANLVEQRPQ